MHNEEEQRQQNQALAKRYLTNVAGIRSDIIAALAHDSKGRIIVAPSELLQCSEAGVDVLSLQVMKVPVLAVASASWKQILEFREDEYSAKKLRRMRMFLYENYLGKSASYIEDQIQIVIEEYETAAKHHGFELFTGTLSMLLSSRSLLATTSASLAAALFGSPLATIIAGGAAVEVGKLSLHVATKRNEFKKWREQHPLAYLIEAREKMVRNGR